ncbi:MAG: PAS domain S-box protein [bacterium]|nr:PAS domain S-box protein [bacterium]
MHILLAEDQQKSRAYGDQVTACASAESALDSSERKHAEEALRESEATWRSLTEHSPDHIMLLDREARILFINHTVPDLNKE